MKQLSVFRIKETELGYIPKKLGRICTVLGNKSISKTIIVQRG